jgi:hypothetical protein
MNGYDKVVGFINRNRNLPINNIPSISYGIYVPKVTGGPFRLALRIEEITPEIQTHIDHIIALAKTEGIEVDVKETGIIGAY